MNAELLSVGTELLLGEILNTDAQYLSSQLSEIGIDVYYQTVVGDNPKRLKNAVELALSRSDIIITSGGLGPTQDDLTKEVLTECMGEELVMHEECLEFVRKYFKKLDKPMAKINEKQAMMPKNCTIIPNNNGTAPGAIIEKNGKIMIMLPGPPNELKPMYKETVKPYLQNKNDYIFHSKGLQIFGIGESSVAEKLDKMMNEYTNPTVAPYAKTAGVRLRITAKCKDVDEGDKLIAPVEKEIRDILGDYIYGIDEDNLPSVVINQLKNNGYKISAAESCTGGMFAKMVTDVSGSSSVIDESIITYSNNAKMKHLGVSGDTLDKYGAVSKETAYEMANGILNNTDADIGVGITGIAGPSGGSEEKPVGLVYIGVAFKESVEVKEFRLNGNRDKIRYSTCLNAFDMVRRILK